MFKLLIFLFLPFLLFASAECYPSYDENARFIPVEQIVNPKSLKKELVLSENLVLPEWMEQSLAAKSLCALRSLSIRLQ